MCWMGACSPGGEARMWKPGWRPLVTSRRPERQALGSRGFHIPDVPARPAVEHLDGPEVLGANGSPALDALRARWDVDARPLGGSRLEIAEHERQTRVVARRADRRALGQRTLVDLVQPAENLFTV